MLNLIHTHLWIYRIILTTIVAGLCLNGYIMSVILWILILYILGKIYEAFFMRGGDTYDRDAVTLKLTMVSRVIDSIWSGFRK